MKNLIISMLALSLAASVYAEDFPGKKSPLYSQRAHNCKAVNLKTWKHSTRKVLEKHNITIKKVELCNDSKYPIFTIEADPMTGYTVKQDNHFIGGWTALSSTNFYNEMWKANAKWPMAIVETGVFVTAYIEKDPKNPSKFKVEEDYEDYTE